jgi:hypothetical protein
MNMPTYKPRPDSLPARVIEFFGLNPDEELGRTDIAQKFSENATTIDSSLRQSVLAGYLQTDSGDDGARVWKAGPNMPPPAGFKAWLASKGQASAEGMPKAKAVQLPPADKLLENIAKDVPVPAPKPRGAEYHAVWARMEKGDSVPMPTAAAKRLISNAQNWGKAHGRKFVMRQIDAEASRIWRTE